MYVLQERASSYGRKRSHFISSNKANYNIAQR